MKKNFFGYIPYDEETFERLWNNAIFVFDANILLNFYRYSNKTKNQILNNIESLSERLWIPYQTCKEFFDNRVSVIVEQDSVYNNINEIFDLSDKIEEVKKLRHSTLDSKKDKMIDILQTCENSLKEILKKDKENSKNIIYDDPNLNRIINIFDNKVGDFIKDEDLKQYQKEIDIRYDNEIPPGYKDKNKKNERKYGDAINWLETIKYSKKNKKDIIYITDDKKEDWIEIKNGKKIGPRKELLNEFYKKTEGQIVYIYNTEKFLEGFNKYISKEDSVESGIIEEIKDLNKNKVMKNEKKYYNNLKMLSEVIKLANSSILVGEEVEKSKFINKIKLVNMNLNNEYKFIDTMDDEFKKFIEILLEVEGQSLDMEKIDSYYKLYKEYLKNLKDD